MMSNVVPFSPRRERPRSVDSVNMADGFEALAAYEAAQAWIGCRAIVVLGRDTGRRGNVVGASSFSPGMVLLSGGGRTLAVHCGSLALETGEAS